MVGGYWRAGWLVLLSLLAACSTTPLRGQAGLLDFLEDGTTSRSEVIARLGQPTRCLRSGEICTYRVSHDEAGRTTMADVMLALGDPDTVAADESWVAYASAYREGGGGAALVLVGGGSAGLLGAARKQMLYRRLLLRFDAAGVVTSASLDLVHCGSTDVYLGTATGSEPPCVDVSAVVRLDLAGLSGARLAGNPFFFTADASKLMQERIEAAARRSSGVMRQPGA